MSPISELLYGIPLLQTAGAMDRVPTGITQDSRKVQAGGIFCAVVGTQVDGHDYIQRAVELGAGIIVCERLPAQIDEYEATYIVVADAAEALGRLASAFFGHPSRKLTLVGVTGTNGKTTIATLLYQLFTGMGYTCGLISTVENKIGEEVILSTHTTPDPVALQKLLATMVTQKVTHAFMEVSSHAIVQRRIAGLHFVGGIFSNITHDHLDFHKTFDNYIAAKKRFFDDLPTSAFALTNKDERRGMVMVQNTVARIRTYALEAPADYKARFLSATVQGNALEIEGKEVWCAMPGKFNAYNTMAVYGTAIELGEPAEEVLRVLSALKGAPGRFETILSPSGITAIVDYAHTPDALQNVLETILNLRQGNERILTVVGAGGDRDTAKRPEMGAIAAKYSDKVFLTSDNPRSEDPAAIIDQMAAGVAITARKKVLREADRALAIEKALHMATAGDIVLIAGKGHETYQEINGTKHPFDDRVEVRKVFGLLRS
jgi:UDP-N-acetylmuramoyl-L-alanyl-D-glutamate--2,6-diaminopimelate ligase